MAVFEAEANKLAQYEAASGYYAIGGLKMVQVAKVKRSEHSRENYLLIRSRRLVVAVVVVVVV